MALVVESDTIVAKPWTVVWPSVTLALATCDVVLTVKLYEEAKSAKNGLIPITPHTFSCSSQLQHPLNYGSTHHTSFTLPTVMRYLSA
jgi:hypothetical protein